ncbi:MAG: hypothetical protein ABF380_07965 [Akkermansiaceae bacterium]
MGTCSSPVCQSSSAIARGGIPDSEFDVVVISTDTIEVEAFNAELGLI